MRLLPLSATAAPVAARPARRVSARRLPLPAPELLVLLALAGVLGLTGLARNGWANEYYAAAVRSMASSWHAFLYGSFDRGGTMTVDKPPLALWVQALSVRVFGWHSLSLLVPQALMGVASVGLVHDLVRRVWGRGAAFAGGLVLVLTPMSVAIARHDNPDALLVLCCVAALWCTVRGLGDGRTRWIALAGVAVGLGFETKMGAALLVVPGLVAAWLWAAPAGAPRGRALLAGGATMAATGLAWPVLMWVTPAADRPWISGTTDNSIWSLILGYNGLGRLDGQAGGPGGGPGGTTFGGASGAGRLWGEALGAQAGWLVGLAIAGALGVAVVTRLRREDVRTGWLLAAGGAFATCAVAFSLAQGIFHPYYVSLLAPFTAALAGATVGLLRSRSFAAHVALPAAVLAGVLSELAVLRYVDGFDRLGVVLVLVGVVGAPALALLESRALRAWVLALALAVLLVAPASWSVQTLGHATSATFPAGGPGVTSAGPAGAGMLGADGSSLTRAATWARAHGGGTVVVASQSGAAGTIVSSGADVAAIGGFSGRESSVTTAWLAGRVASGQIRWVLVERAAGGGPGLPGDTRTGSDGALAAVAATCRRVSGWGGSGTLYDCAGAVAGLRAAA